MGHSMKTFDDVIAALKPITKKKRKAIIARVRRIEFEKLQLIAPLIDRPLIHRAAMIASLCALAEQNAPQDLRAIIECSEPKNPS